MVKKVANVNKKWRMVTKVANSEMWRMVTKVVNGDKWRMVMVKIVLKVANGEKMVNDDVKKSSQL